MQTRLFHLCLSLLLSSFPISASAEWATVFATPVEAGKLLAERDEFTAQLSPFDRSARMRTDREVSEDEFVAFVSSAARAWKEDDRNLVEAALAEIRPAVSRLLPTLKGPIHLVTTSGDEEAHHAYTRGSVIVIPEKVLRSRPETLRKTLAHEIFHIFTRQNPRMRDALYAAIGFHPCKVELPSTLRSRKITNPDAPNSSHCIDVILDGKAVRAAPVLYANAPKYDTARGGDFFNYLVFALMLVDDGPGDARMVTVAQVSGFFEQIGRNTRYVIHPEEVLADNFALLVLGQTNVPSPEMLQKMTQTLASGN